VTGLAVAEKLNVPFVQTHLQPVSAPTSAYPGVMTPWWPRWLGQRGMHLSHRLSDKAAWMAFKRPMASARSSVLGLTGSPPSVSDQPRLYGFSPHVVPVPADGNRRVACGYWTLPVPSHWSPPPALVDFLARPGPVVSIGFGSMASADPKQVTELIFGAIRRAGVRAVLLSGWGGMDALSSADDVYCADALPHDWLFPKVAAIVHHGGAGTTGAAFIAGVPAVVIPFTADQPFWAARVATLGCGPTPVPRKQLTAQNLAKALVDATTHAAMKARAAELGSLIRQERGVETAVACFDKIRMHRGR
jgi:sterol 3beta-glucosyltransferase